MHRRPLWSHRRISIPWALALLVRAAPAPAADAVLRLECPTVPREAVAQVEARTRVTLLTSDIAATRVTVSCTDVRVERDERGGRTSSWHDIPTTYGDWSDGVLAALASTLAELGQHASRAVSAPSPVGADAAAVGPMGGDDSDRRRSLPPASPSEDRPRALPASIEIAPQGSSGPGTNDGVSFGVTALTEAWGAEPALGVSISVARRVRRLQYGLMVGIAGQPHTGTAFSSAEGCMGGEVRYQIPKWEVLLLAGAGVSLLYVTPNSDVRPSGAQAITLPSLEGRVAVPLRVGRFSVAPGLGGRFFFASRAVNLDGVQQLVVGAAVARLSIDFTYDPSTASEALPSSPF